MKIERIAVVGLGYVGLPLALALGREHDTVGFDRQEQRVLELRKGYDRNGEHASGDLRAPRLVFSHDAADLATCDMFIVAVPTPVDEAKRPDLKHLLGASRTVGDALARRDPSRGVALVVFESTVYPGCTEEVCGPEIERVSHLRRGVHFKLGYSPERINPGDREHTFERIVKVVAGEDEESASAAAQIYGSVVEAGIYRAPTIRTAEAAKVIENTQRDLNIALMNELSIMFHRMGIDTHEVLKAAGTKWNFLPFKPGLVGGHCIPEDPYYLTYKAQAVGYHPEVILAGRRINDGMGRHVAREAIRLLIRRDRPLRGSRALILGVSFKENVRDTRNTRVLDLVHELQDHGVVVEAHDPIVGADGIRSLPLVPAESPFGDSARYDLVVLAVGHKSFRDRSPAEYAGILAPGGAIVDIPAALSRSEIERLGITYWRL